MSTPGALELDSPPHESLVRAKTVCVAALLDQAEIDVMGNILRRGNKAFADWKRYRVIGTKFSAAADVFRKPFKSPCQEKSDLVVVFTAKLKDVLVSVPGNATTTYQRDGLGNITGANTTINGGGTKTAQTGTTFMYIIDPTGLIVWIGGQKWGQPGLGALIGRPKSAEQSMVKELKDRLNSFENPKRKK